MPKLIISFLIIHISKNTIKISDNNANTNNLASFSYNTNTIS